jgi:hypothetical protein
MQPWLDMPLLSIPVTSPSYADFGPTDGILLYAIGTPFSPIGFDPSSPMQAPVPPFDPNPPWWFRSWPGWGSVLFMLLSRTIYLCWISAHSQHSLQEGPEGWEGAVAGDCGNAPEDADFEVLDRYCSECCEGFGDKHPELDPGEDADQRCWNMCMGLGWDGTGAGGATY